MIPNNFPLSLNGLLSIETHQDDQISLPLGGTSLRNKISRGLKIFTFSPFFSPSAGVKSSRLFLTFSLS